MKHWTSIVVVLVLCVALHLPQAHTQVTCTTAGRFANPTDTTCKNYTLCVFVSTNSTFVSYNYVCPTTSLFNPTTSLCTSPLNYTCPGTGTGTAANNCAAEGFFTDPNVSDCSAYIQCVALANGAFSQTNLPCPAGTFYNPTSTLCETTYVCPTTFTCAAVGRFANTVDATCQSYFYCVLTATGTFVQYNYTCPTTSVFSPTARLCTANYTCPTATTNVG